MVSRLDGCQDTLDSYHCQTLRRLLDLVAHNAHPRIPKSNDLRWVFLAGTRSYGLAG